MCPDDDDDDDDDEHSGVTDPPNARERKKSERERDARWFCPPLFYDVVAGDTGRVSFRLSRRRKVEGLFLSAVIDWIGDAFATWTKREIFFIFYYLLYVMRITEMKIAVRQS